MTEASTPIARLVLVILTTRQVLGYENAYDLAERRRNDPNNRFYESLESRYYNRYQDRDRYSTHNSSPSSVYSSVRQTNNRDPGFVLGRRSSVLGNGYDNLGNTGLNSFDSNKFFDNRKNDFLNRGDDSFGRRWDNNRRWDSSQSSDVFPEKRRFDEPFRNDDRNRFDTFRGVDFDNRRRNDPLYPDVPQLDYNRDRDRDIFRDDSRRLSPSFDKPRVIDPLNRDIFRDDSGRLSSSFEKPQVIDLPNRDIFGDDSRRLSPSFEKPRVFDLSNRGSFIDTTEVGYRPLLQRRNDHPDFYRKDYFVRDYPQGQKASGFETEKSDKNFQKSGGENSNSGVSTVGSYLTSNEDENQKKTNSGYLDNKEGSKLDVANKEKIGETTRFDKNGGNKSTLRSNRVSKKGHTTKGFATHHHKDETGNSTTFFDETSDSGGQSDYKDLEDEFGTRKTMEVLNGKEDGRFFQENGGKTGNFGSAILQDNKKVNKDIVSNDKNFSQEERYGDGKDVFDRGFKTASEYLGGGIWGDDTHHH